MNKASAEEALKLSVVGGSLCGIYVSKLQCSVVEMAGVADVAGVAGVADLKIKDKILEVGSGRLIGGDVWELGSW